jgi:hypothetical protein
LGFPNSPEINDFEIPELHLDGALNSDGVQLLRIRSATGSYPLHVIDEQFAVVLPNQTLSGADLLGWKIDLDSPDGHYLLEIAGVDTIPSLADGAPPMVRYALKYESHLVPGEILNVCPEATPDETVVTLIRDETYDREHKLVVPDQYGWFTLACADQAAYKMQRMNYGPNADFNGTPSPATVDERQATLKMITADYCGKGFSFTAQGTPILWRDADKTVGIEPPANAALEAYWSADGALCLDRPRLVGSQDVESECVLPPCSKIDVEDPRIVWTTHTN